MALHRGCLLPARADPGTERTKIRHRHPHVWRGHRKRALQRDQRLRRGQAPLVPGRRPLRRHGRAPGPEDRPERPVVARQFLPRQRRRAPCPGHARAAAPGQRRLGGRSRALRGQGPARRLRPCGHGQGDRANHLAAGRLGAEGLLAVVGQGAEGEGGGREGAVRRHKGLLHALHLLRRPRGAGGSGGRPHRRCPGHLGDSVALFLHARRPHHPL
mmetsp:Transcript_89075/g.276814  ORF Transcript_89075/g.276814 Transcript_89075/m.276814 type:complete len:215 (-) Transcript_89075:137-781(-)